MPKKHHPPKSVKYLLFLDDKNVNKNVHKNIENQRKNPLKNIKFAV